MSHCTLIVANAGGRRCTWLTRMTRSVRSETNFSYSTVFLVGFRYTSLTCKKKNQRKPFFKWLRFPFPILLLGFQRLRNCPAAFFGSNPLDAQRCGGNSRENRRFCACFEDVGPEARTERGGLDPGIQGAP